MPSKSALTAVARCRGLLQDLRAVVINRADAIHTWCAVAHELLMVCIHDVTAASALGNCVDGQSAMDPNI